MTSVASADISKLADALKQTAQQSGVTTQEVLVQSANHILAEMEAKTPVKTGTLRKSRYPAVPRPQTTARQLDDGPTAAIRCRRQAMNPRAYSTSRPVDGHALVTLADTGDTGRSR